MGISSLGVGSNILTQDVLDQLRAADEAKFVAPLDRRLSAEKAKSAAFEILDALMENVYGSLKSLTEYGVFESRSSSVSNEDRVSIKVLENSNVEDFALNVSQLATKEITQSGQFAKNDSSISSTAGTMTLSVGSQTFDINYEASTTLTQLKDLINKEASDGVSASIVQINNGDFRLVLSASETGTGQAISVADSSGGTLSTALLPDPDSLENPDDGIDDGVDGMTSVQNAVDASFTYNGISITRTSNSIDDLLLGVTITLKETGSTTISIQQSTENIEEKFTNFIDKYNSAMFQLNEDTNSSIEVSERGAFSSDSTMKAMKSAMITMLSTVGERVGKISDFGIILSDDGRLSLDSDILKGKLLDDPTSVQAFFVGGTFTSSIGTTTQVSGAFVELENEMAKYSKRGNILDEYKDSIKTRYDSIKEQKEKAIARLNVSFEIQKKRFAAYDAVISRFNSASSMFSQLVDAQLAAKN